MPGEPRREFDRYSHAAHLWQPGSMLHVFRPLHWNCRRFIDGALCIALRHGISAERVHRSLRTIGDGPKLIRDSTEANKHEGL